VQHFGVVRTLWRSTPWSSERRDSITAAGPEVMRMPPKVQSVCLREEKLFPFPEPHAAGAAEDAEHHPGTPGWWECDCRWPDHNDPKPDTLRADVRVGTLLRRLRR